MYIRQFSKPHNQINDAKSQSKVEQNVELDQKYDNKCATLLSTLEQEKQQNNNIKVNKTKSNERAISIFIDYANLIHNLRKGLFYQLRKQDLLQKVLGIILNLCLCKTACMWIENKLRCYTKRGRIFWLAVAVIRISYHWL